MAAVHAPTRRRHTPRVVPVAPQTPPWLWLAWMSVALAVVVFFGA